MTYHSGGTQGLLTPESHHFELRAGSCVSLPPRSLGNQLGQFHLRLSDAWAAKHRPDPGYRLSLAHPSRHPVMISLIRAKSPSAKSLSHFRIRFLVSSSSHRMS